MKAYETGLPDDREIVLEQTIVKVGPVVFVPFPFEMFSEISLRLRDYSPFQYTLALGLTNGCCGYLPAESEICRGGYEVEMFLLNSLTPMKRDTDKTIVAENIRIMKDLL